MDIRQVIWDVVEWVVNVPTLLGILLRGGVYPIFLKMPWRFSKRKLVKFYRNIRITKPDNFSIGEGSSIHLGNIFLSEGDILIGNNVLIAPNCVFTSHQHSFLDKDLLIYDQPITDAPIVINDNVWIGAGCVILPGIEIGEGSIVGAGSIVTKSIPQMEIWAGNPASRIRKR